jgi:hypothetical protein
MKHYHQKFLVRKIILILAETHKTNKQSKIKTNYCCFKTQKIYQSKKNTTIFALEL